MQSIVEVNSDPENDQELQQTNENSSNSSKIYKSNENLIIFNCLKEGNNEYIEIYDKSVFDNISNKIFTQLQLQRDSFKIFKHYRQ